MIYIYDNAPNIVNQWGHNQWGQTRLKKALAIATKRSTAGGRRPQAVIRGWDSRIPLRFIRATSDAE